MVSKGKILSLILCASLCTSLLANETVETEEVATPVVIEESVTEHVVEKPAKKQSLIKMYPEIFSRGHILVLNSIGDPDATQVKLFNPDCAEIYAYNCAKEKDCPECGKWDKDAKVTRATKRVYGSGVKIDKKYKGHRKHFWGLALQELLGIAGEYNGTILIDQYKQYPMWNVILKDRVELNNLLDYLQRNLEAKGKKSFDKKPILLLNLKGDPYLETLEIEDKARLNFYFEVVDYADNKTVEFFRNSQITMDEIIINFEAGKPHYVGENMRERIMRELETLLSDFEVSKMAPKLGFYVAVGITGVFFATYIYPPILKFILGKKPE
jgi:hypothetical protein